MENLNTHGRKSLVKQYGGSPPVHAPVAGSTGVVLDRNATKLFFHPEPRNLIELCELQ